MFKISENRSDSTPQEAKAGLHKTSLPLVCTKVGRVVVFWLRFKVPFRAWGGMTSSISTTGTAVLLQQREKRRGRKVEGEKSREKGLLDGGGLWQVLLVLRLLPG